MVCLQEDLGSIHMMLRRENEDVCPFKTSFAKYIGLSST